MSTDIDKIVEIFEKKKVRREPGLTDKEIEEVEVRFQFRFPPDYRLLIQTVLPVSVRFYNWRKSLSDSTIAAKIQEMLARPCDGILFDIEHNQFWMYKELPGVHSWGTKPKTKKEQFEIARQEIASYSKLIPIYSHRYIPETPHEMGNPVFSVHQSDIIYYGSSLLNYFLHEYKIGRSRRIENPKHIPFWSDCCINWNAFKKDID